MTPSSFTRAYVAHDLGGDLHRLAQRAAVVAAAVYVAGLAAGVVIHWANDWLSGDRRPWPVTWGATFITLTVQPETSADSRATVVNLVASWSVTELRALAKAEKRMHVYRSSVHGYIPISQASKSELIAALQ